MRTFSSRKNAIALRFTSVKKGRVNIDGMNFFSVLFLVYRLFRVVLEKNSTCVVAGGRFGGIHYALMLFVFCFTFSADVYVILLINSNIPKCFMKT